MKILAPAVFDDTVDVVKRRCSSNLASPGWYRVLTTSDSNTSGSIFHFAIGRKTVAGVAAGEAHTIDFFMVGGGKSAFMNEESDANVLYIDKIRCTYGDDLVHFDVHYSSSNAADVFVDFTVEGNTLSKQNAVAESLQAVADSPTGETVLTSYGFDQYVNNGCIVDTRNVTSSAGGYFQYTDYTRDKYAIISSTTTASDVLIIPSGSALQSGQWCRAISSALAAYGSQTFSVTTVFKKL